MLNQLCRLTGGAFRLAHGAATRSAASLALFGTLLLLSAALPSGPVMAQCMGTIDGGDNSVTCNMGNEVASVSLLGGNDTLNISGTYFLGIHSIFGNDGNDTLTITGGTFDSLNVSSNIAGGDFGQLTSAGNDTLTLDGFTGKLSFQVYNWDTINVVGGSDFQYEPGLGIFYPRLDQMNPDAVFNIAAGSRVSVAADGNPLNDTIVTGIGRGEFRLNGLVDLANGEVGDLFFVESQGGTYSGTGSVALDAFFDGATGGSDIFWVTFATAEAGTSIGLQVDVVGIGAEGFMLPVALQSRDAMNGAPASPDTFYLEGGVASSGNYLFDLVFVPDAIVIQDSINDGWFLTTIGLASGYQTHVTAAQRLFQTNMQTMRERMSYLRGEVYGDDHMEDAATGEQSADLGSADYAEQQAEMDGGRPGRDEGISVWVDGRFDHTEDEQDGMFDVGYTSNANGVLVGGDYALDGIFSGSDRLLLGAFAGYGSTDADYDAAFTGNFDVSGPMVGAYATYLSGFGLYLDGVLAYQRLHFDSVNDTTTATASYDGDAFGLSLEAGYRVNLGGGFEIEPQVQLSYTNVTHEDFVDSVGTTVSDDEGYSLQLRGGLRAFTTFDITDDVSIRPHVDVGVVHEFAEDNSVVVLGSTFKDALYETAIEVGGGFTVDFPYGMKVFVDVDYRGADNYNNVNGMVGLRLSF